MEKVRVVLTVLVVCAALTVTASLARAADEGEKVFQKQCNGACHGTEKMEGKHLDRAGWNEIVERMKGLGAEVPKKGEAELLDYLVKAYGPDGSAGQSGTSK